MQVSTTLGIQVFVRQALRRDDLTLDEVHADVQSAFPRALGRKEVKKTLWRMHEAGEVGKHANRYFLRGS